MGDWIPSVPTRANLPKGRGAKLRVKASKGPWQPSYRRAGSLVIAADRPDRLSVPGMYPQGPREGGRAVSPKVFVLALLGIGLLGLIAATSTLSVFTDSASVGSNSFTTGTVDITTSPTSAVVTTAAWRRATR